MWYLHDGFPLPKLTIQNNLMISRFTRARYAPWKDNHLHFNPTHLFSSKRYPCSIWLGKNIANYPTHHALVFFLMTSRKLRLQWNSNLHAGRFHFHFCLSNDKRAQMRPCVGAESLQLCTLGRTSEVLRTETLVLDELNQSGTSQPSVQVPSLMGWISKSGSNVSEDKFLNRFWFQQMPCKAVQDRKEQYP